MNKYTYITVILCSIINLNAQVDNDSLDYKYFEDQFYASFSYNITHDKAASVSENLFSVSVTLGYMRDIPINKKRNTGFAIGVGYGYNVYNKNIVIDTENALTTATTHTDYNKNRIVLNRLEVPIQFRWRTSTPATYKFWRVYGGMKWTYVMTSKYKYEDNESNISIKNGKFFSKFSYGLILSAGYSTWNLYVYYGLSPLFHDVTIDGGKLNIKDFNLGLKFYIL